ncbi:MAG: flagellar FliJ family protein [Vampirovibrionales bacterium]
MFNSPGFMLESHDIFIQKLNDDLEQLEHQVVVCQEQLAYEKQMLIKATMDLEALEKHKEKAREEHFEEEKMMELKKLDEVASQRYFRQQQEHLEEEHQFEDL